MFSRFFVRRPVFAWVIAILIMLAGMLAIRTLPVAQYPDVAPPSIKISATYTGASAQTLENSVTQVIEQQLTGLDNLLYFTFTIQVMVYEHTSQLIANCFMNQYGNNGGIYATR